MEKKTQFVSADLLKDFIRDVFIKAGAPKQDADVCADVIITSDLRGIESHGISRLKYYYIRMKRGQHQVVTNFEIVKEGPATAVVDGHHGLGMVIAKKAMQIAIDKARVYGMGSVAVRNSTHFGIAGYYPMMACQQGMIGFTVTNARPATSPTFGTQPLLGTNPIAFGAPTLEEFPFLYDGATPISQRGKIEVLAREKKVVPDAWVVDAENKPMTDAEEILAALGKGNAAFLPIGGSSEVTGGHKGYGLSTMVEILSAGLQTGRFLTALTGVGEGGEHVPFKLGHFFMAIDIEAFCPLEDFQRTTTAILQELRASRKAPGHDRIYTAGEKEFEKEKQVRAHGIPVNAELQAELLEIKQELGLNQYQFLF